MSPSFNRAFLNFPDECSAEQCERDPDGQPATAIPTSGRLAEFTAIFTSMPQKRGGEARQTAMEIEFAEGQGRSTSTQQYDPMPIINRVGQRADAWPPLSSSSQRKVTSEAARLLQHLRDHSFGDASIVWLTEATTKPGGRKQSLDRLSNASNRTNLEPLLPASRLAIHRPADRPLWLLAERGHRERKPCSD